MTKQITVRFNKQKWKPIFDAIRITASNDTTFVKRCVWYVYMNLHFPVKELSGLTEHKYVTKSTNITIEEHYVTFLKSYEDFNKNGISLPK